MGQDGNYKNWSMITDADNCCWLTLDREGTSVNTLNMEVFQEFDHILDALHTQIPKGLVIKSGKSNGFIAGADVSAFMEVTAVNEATQLVKQVHRIYDKLEAMPCPTVAMINGFCLGGGLELALACKYRVALDSPKTRIGLPEILLGIYPGWGGSIRLPKLIGSVKAMELILQGKTVDARTAQKLGIVDAAVPDRYFESAVQHYLHNAPPSKHAGNFEKFIQLRFVRNLMGRFLRRQVAKKANPKDYPAPFALIDAWVNNSIYSDKAAEAEATAVANLIMTPTARNLIRVFFLRERLKGFAKKTNFDPKHVHVIGAGVMGGDIAAWCALMGFDVTVQDQNLAAISSTLERATQLFTKRLKVAYLVQGARDRLMPDPKGIGIARADVIIEAIIEKVEAKQQVFSMLEQKAKPGAILASNTSTIPLELIGKTLQRPERIVGIHFFNPVALMPLVEVVFDAKTDQKTIQQAESFIGKIDKLPLPVKSAPGFLVNRVLIPYLLEAALMYDEGIPGPVIDKAATDFGMPMGPIELMDTVGLDVCLAGAKSINAPISDKLVDLVAKGKLGKKTNEGIYKYKHGKVVKPKVAGTQKYPDDIQDRLIMRLLNEARAALREKIVSDADLVDAGMIFGTGFAPFRGGPMTYAAEQPKGSIKTKLEQLASRYGDRFVPDPGWN